MFTQGQGTVITYGKRQEKIRSSDFLLKTPIIFNETRILAKNTLEKKKALKTKLHRYYADRCQQTL